MKYHIITPNIADDEYRENLIQAKIMALKQWIKLGYHSDKKPIVTDVWEENPGFDNTLMFCLKTNRNKWENI